MSIPELVRETPPSATNGTRTDGRSRTPWPAVRGVARSELRRRWRALLALALLAGLVGAVVLAAAQLERRTATAYPRLQDETGLDDARLPIPPGPLAQQFAALPPVRSAWPATVVVGQVQGPGVVYLSIASGPPRPSDLLTPIVTSGRLPADDRPDEILLAEDMVKESGLTVGARIDLKLLTAREVDQFDTGFGEPDGPKVGLRVVGIGRFPGWGSGLGYVLGTPAFAQRYSQYSPGGTLLLRLKDEPDARAQLESGVSRLLGPTPRAASEASGPPGPTYSRPGDPSVLSTQQLLSTSLLVFLVIASLASVLTVLQAGSRHAAMTLDDQHVEDALGMTRGERRLARVLPALPFALLAGMVAAAGGLATAGREPLGTLAQFEPHPGWVPNLGLLGLGAAVVAIAFLLAVALTAAPALRRGTAPAPAVARRLPLLRRSPTGTAGGAFALARGRSRSSTPLRSGVIGVVVGVAGMIASLVFAASAAHLSRTPTAYGWSADVITVDAKEPDVARLVGDPRVRDLDVLDETTVSVGSRSVNAVSRTPRKGDLPWTTARGRLPVAPNEVAVGPRLAHELDVAVGDDLTLRDAAGRPHPLHVVGISMVATDSDAQLGSSLVLTPPTLPQVSTSPAFRSALIRAAPGAAGGLIDELGARYEIATPGLPVEVRNLHDLGALPLLLGAFYVAVGAAALVHSLVVTSRRRIRDLAVLRALGFTSGQVVLTLVVMALTMVVLGLVIAVPFGLGVGRIVWNNAVTGIGATSPPVIPWVELVLLVAGALLFAVAAALAIALRARPRNPSATLRTE